MKLWQIFSITVSLIGLSVIFMIASPQQVFAQTSCESVYHLTITPSEDDLIQDLEGRELTITISDPRGSLSSQWPSSNFYPCVVLATGYTCASSNQPINAGDTITYTINTPRSGIPGPLTYFIVVKETSRLDNTVCRSDTPITIARTSDQSNNCTIQISQTVGGNTYENPGCLDTTNPINISISNITFRGQPYTGNAIAYFKGTNRGGVLLSQSNNYSNSTTDTPPPNSSYKIIISDINTNTTLCETPALYDIKPVCTEEEREPINPNLPEAAAFDLCGTLNGEAKTSCTNCLDNNSVWTALGCIPTSPEGFTGAFLKIAIGVGGGLALLLMIYGAFLMATSAGNPETAQKGKQVFGGAIMGLLFIIFSVVLLQIIGIEILQIPGL